jgi:hypothetical protein
MRTVPMLVLVAAAMPMPAGAQSVVPPAPAQSGGPNAQAAQRPLGPNAQAAVGRPAGPNTAIARGSKLVTEIHYPNCAAAGAARKTPLRRGEPGYGRHLDRDGNGIACE